MPIITIDGNIGACKSLILENLQRKHNQLISLEPINEWEKLLTDIYLNDEGYFNLELRIFLDRGFIQSNNNTIIFIERSSKFTRETFIETYKEKFTLQEYNILNYLYDNADNKLNKNITEPVIYFYIQSSPEKCLDTIKTRDRSIEKCVNIEFLQNLHDKHECCYENAYKQGFPIHKINSDDKTIEEISNCIMKHIYG